MSKNKKDSLLELAEKVKNAISGLSELENEVKSALAGLTEENGFNPDTIEWVDLGLPSGRLWAKENAPGLHTFDEAIEKFGDLVPKAVSMAELYESCDWEWDNEKKGYIVTGPNGNSIFLPAAGYKDSDGDLNSVGSVGEYWTSCPSKTSQTYARRLDFGSGDVGPLDSGSRSRGFSVRPSRENF